MNKEVASWETIWIFQHHQSNCRKVQSAVKGQDLTNNMAAADTCMPRKRNHSWDSCATWWQAAW